MKKLLFAFLFVFTAAIAALAQDSAATSEPTPATPPSSEYQNADQDQDKDKQPIAASELPAAITAALEGQDYSGWTVANAFKKEKDGQMMYIVELKNGSETKEVKFDAQGTKLKDDKEEDKDKGQQ